MGHRLEVLEYLLCSDGLTKEGQGAKKLGGEFFLSKNKVISRFSVSIDVQNFTFHPEIIVISKKERSSLLIEYSSNAQTVACKALGSGPLSKFHLERKLYTCIILENFY